MAALGQTQSAVPAAEAVSLHGSAAQCCAADALAVAFAFLPLYELPASMRACRQWRAAAAKGTQRAVRLPLDAGSASALCRNGSPLLRHVGTVALDNDDSLSLALMQQLHALPGLTALRAALGSAELQRLQEQNGVQALADLRTAFPPRLRELLLFNCTPAASQLLLNALPVLPQLERLLLHGSEYAEPSDYDSLSPAPLLQLPRLVFLEWFLGEPTHSQLLTIKQMQPLRELSVRLPVGGWTAERLAILCRPPHRLQQLQRLELFDTAVGAVEMAELIHLPGLTSLAPGSLHSAAFALLPRLPLLQALTIRLADFAASDDALRSAQCAAISTALRACPGLTQLTVLFGGMTEARGARLLQSLPRLRELRLLDVTLPTLAFLRHAPQLYQLELVMCYDVLPAHFTQLVQSTPRLVQLSVDRCYGLRLDDSDLKALTPPTRLLPNLVSFKYVLTRA